jgi:hypothetical protein
LLAPLAAYCSVVASPVVSASRRRAPPPKCGLDDSLLAGLSAEEVGVDAADETHVLVAIDAAYYRPTEVDLLLGDASKARAKLGWAPKVAFGELVKEMVASDQVLVDKGEFAL